MENIDNKRQSKITNPFRLSFILTVIFSFLLALAMGAFTLQSISKESNRIISTIKQQANVLADNIAATSGDLILSYDYTSIELMLLRSSKFPGILKLQLVNHKGNLIGDILNVAGQKEPEILYGQEPLTTPNNNNPSTEIKDNQLIVWKPIVLGSIIGWVKLTFTLDEVKKVQAEYWRDYTISSIIIILFTSITMILFMYHPISAIERYTNFADRLNEVKEKNVKISNYSLELQKLGGALNSTSKRLYEQNNAIETAMLDLKRLAVFPENNPNITISINREGEVEYINPHGKETLKQLNFSKEEIIWILPVNISDIMEECFLHMKAIRNVECSFKDHIYRWTFAPVEDQDILHCYALEITESEKAKEEARKAELKKITAEAENKAKSAFLANMSHEIRTPLTLMWLHYSGQKMYKSLK